MAKTILSASKIKTLKSCSWLFWAKYKLMVPDTTNSGALIGSIAHCIFECLGKPRHQKHYDIIIKKSNCFASKVVKRLILKHAKRDNVDSKEQIVLIKSMILNGLKHDFHGQTLGEPIESISEFEFDIHHKEEDDEFKLKGFIDKLFIYKNLALVRDYKSNKKAFAGKEASENIQDYLYTLAVKKLFPHVKEIKMEFVFIKDGVLDGSEENLDGIAMIMAPKSHYEMVGFASELTEIQRYADSFNEKTALSNLAAKQPFPKDGSFSGPLLCGFAKFPGQIKKDGNPMWHCSMKFPIDFYSLYDEKGEIIKSSFEKSDLIKIKKDNQSIKNNHYGGCPCFNKK
jgi:hypothetical protein